MKIGRLLGYLVIATAWAMLLGVLVFFGAVYAMYADMKASDRSRLTAGTPLEFIGNAFYDRFRSPWATLRDPVLAYVPKPGQGRLRSPEYDTFYSITPDGVRGRTTAVRSDRDLIVMVGDSFTFGLGANDDQTYSALLAQRYHYNTVNTGVIGYGSARELLRLQKLGWLNKASMLVIQFCWNDGRENNDFLRDPTAPFVSSEPTESWTMAKMAERLDLSYLNVLKATVQYLTYRIQTDGALHSARLLAKSRRTAFGLPIHVRDNRSGADLAKDFLSVIDHFPELKGKPILVIELNDRGGTTGFIRALQQDTKDRPTIEAVELRLREADYYRFDGHLVPAGHEAVAAQLDAAIKQFQARLAPGR